MIYPEYDLLGFHSYLYTLIARELIDKLNFQIIRIISSIISSLSEKHSKHSFNWFEADFQLIRSFQQQPKSHPSTQHSIRKTSKMKKTKQITCPHFNLQNECVPFIVQIALSLIVQSTPIAQMIKKKNDQFFFHLLIRNSSKSILNIEFAIFFIIFCRVAKAAQYSMRALYLTNEHSSFMCKIPKLQATI